jgi:hypothetical protein
LLRKVADLPAWLLQQLRNLSFEHRAFHCRHIRRNMADDHITIVAAKARNQAMAGQQRLDGGLIDQDREGRRGPAYGSGGRGRRR